ncbi:MAG TPA: DNA topoisomerase IB [Candidatus Binatia bacterium]|jgi:DNA topoisomerase-1
MLKDPGHSKASAARSIPIDPARTARLSHLRYVTDDLPGITRKRTRKGFRYFDSQGRELRQRETLRRIESLAIPPAWNDVWISPWANAHLQATGRDAKGRKQHRYHARWREIRDQTKFDRLSAFGRVLPGLRRRLNRDLARPGLPREKVLATVVKLLETTFIRVGNEEYARHNGSFGLTTMRNKHAKVSGATIRFEFRGKSGKTFSLDLNDRRLAKIVNYCQELPGQELFQYIDDAGQRRTISSSDVNAYLREVSGEDFTAKDFRTWAGTVLAAGVLREIRHFDTKAQAKRNIVSAIETVAKRLGNTRSVCRKCYIHPAVIDAYIDGSLPDTLSQKVNRKTAQSADKLNPDESAVMLILDRQSKSEAKRKAA